ncbi:MAG: DUF1592 domain-containing protein [Planctomycetales bacterium]|nr:DUF1592 domain-containing protein [Planctomycetales bacterium]
MKIGWTLLCWLTYLFAGRIHANADDSVHLAPGVKTFLARHCVSCHGPETQEAEMRVDSLGDEFDDRSIAERWTEVLDRLNRGDMPPENEPRPDKRQQARVVDWISQQLQSAIERKHRNGGHAILRRLNRDQYNNTIRDLVGVDFAPADSFPEDPSGFGFNNVGSALNLSPLHIEKYLDAAREIVARANLYDVQPVPFQWHFEPDTAARTNRHQRLTKPDRRGREIEYAIVYARDMLARGDFAVIREKRRRHVGVRNFFVHRPGRYVIRVRAASYVPKRAEVQQAAVQLFEEHYQQLIAEADDDDLRRRRKEYWENTKRQQVSEYFGEDSAYNYGPPRMQITINRTLSLPAVDVDVPKDQPKVFEFPVYLEDNECNINIANDYNIPEYASYRTTLFDPRFPRPELLIDWFEIEGPIDEQWPPKSRKMVLRSFKPDDPDRARKIIATFIHRAYRRPPKVQEVNRMMALYEKARAESDSLEEALEVPLVAILSSPRFLYLAEEAPAHGERAQVTDYELASRLSYWLWNTMPDDALFRLAKNRELGKREVLLKQVDRMLADKRSDEFVKSFVTQWLRIGDLNSVLPDKRKYLRFDEHLLTSMTDESVAYFRELLDNDLPIQNFVRSEFAVVNERLARHYELSGIEGDHFRRVDLGPNSGRGPIMMHASVHMATSNGTRTSPVKRGEWILESVLGTPSPPPPPNAGDIKPGVPGIDKATVRERLDAHRQNPACASCHDKIDPLGFALENYDAIGRWRTHEGFGYNGQVLKGDPAVDTHGQLPDGSSFQNIQQLQEILLRKQELFNTCLVKKMMIYALGRGLDISDRPTILNIVEDLPKHGSTLRGIIKQIATSEQFLTKTIGAQP